jgi:hypothetical protein
VVPAYVPAETVNDVGTRRTRTLSAALSAGGATGTRRRAVWYRRPASSIGSMRTSTESHGMERNAKAKLPARSMSTESS